MPTASLEEAGDAMTNEQMLGVRHKFLGKAWKVLLGWILGIFT